MIVSLVGIVLLAVVWRRMKERSWYAIPGDSTLGTPKEEDFSADDTDRDDDDNMVPDSTTSTTAVRSPPRRQRVLSPKFTIGSDDEEDENASVVSTRQSGDATRHEAPGKGEDEEV